MSMKKRIILHGYLAELYPDAIEVEATSVAEAMSALSQIKELHRADGQPHPVAVRGIDTEIALFAETDMEEIHVYPRTGGAGGKSGLGQILLGITLIAVAFVFPGVSLLGGMITQSSLFLAGGMMLLGGILQMLAPSPEISQEGDSSNQLGSGVNTVRIGTTIPLAYGTCKLAGHYLSFDVDAKDRAGGEVDDTVTPALTVTLTDFEEGLTAENTAIQAAIDALPPEDQVDPSEVAIGISADGTTDQELNTYTIYDRTPVPVAVPLPVFASPTASPSNIPTSGWIS